MTHKYFNIFINSVPIIAAIFFGLKTYTIQTRQMSPEKRIEMIESKARQRIEANDIAILKEKYQLCEDSYIAEAKFSNSLLEAMKWLCILIGIFGLFNLAAAIENLRKAKPKKDCT